MYTSPVHANASNRNSSTIATEMIPRVRNHNSHISDTLQLFSRFGKVKNGPHLLRRVIPPIFGTKLHSRSTNRRRHPELHMRTPDRCSSHIHANHSLMKHIQSTSPSRANPARLRSISMFSSQINARPLSKWPSPPVTNLFSIFQFSIFTFQSATFFGIHPIRTYSRCPHRHQFRIPCPERRLHRRTLSNSSCRRQQASTTFSGTLCLLRSIAQRGLRARSFVCALFYCPRPGRQWSPNIALFATRHIVFRLTVEHNPLCSKWFDCEPARTNFLNWLDRPRAAKSLP